jgi:hypothetical protein
VLESGRCLDTLLRICRLGLGFLPLENLLLDSKTALKAAQTHYYTSEHSPAVPCLSGGGHAFLGLHLAKQLLSAGHSVTILNDGDQVSYCPPALMHNSLNIIDSPVLFMGSIAARAQACARLFADLHHVTYSLNSRRRRLSANMALWKEPR